MRNDTLKTTMELTDISTLGGSKNIVFYAEDRPVLSVNTNAMDFEKFAGTGRQTLRFFAENRYGQWKRN